MYSKQESSRLRHEFWTKFGGIMAPHRSSEGRKVNWVNYKTGVRHIFLRTQADAKSAYIGIEIQHPDDSERELFYEQFLELKAYFHSLQGEEWEWEPLYFTELGCPIARVYQICKEVNVFEQGMWPNIMQFFQPRLLAFDEFWGDAQHAFLDLMH